MSNDAKEEAPAKKKGKLPIIIVAAVLLLGGAGAGAWYFLKTPHDAETADAAEHGEEAKPKPKPRKKAHANTPVFVTIDPFVFNLQDSEQDRFAQIGVVLQVEEAAVEAELKTVSPAVRNALLMLMSSKTSGELLSVRGKQELSEQVVEAANAILAGEKPPRVQTKASARAREDAPRQKSRSVDESSGAGSHASGTAANDHGDHGDDVDPQDDRRDDRRDRRAWYPERVTAAHFSQFIVQ